MYDIQILIILFNLDLPKKILLGKISFVDNSILIFSILYL